MAKLSMSDCRGLGPIGWIIAFPVALIALLLLAVGFFEARKAYWDYKVDKMCEKDGGVEVYETVTITENDQNRLTKLYGKFQLPHEDEAQENFPYFYRIRDSMIRKTYPKVGRTEVRVLRRLDQKILGRSVQYWRRGGDIPTGLSHGSSYICPQQTALNTKIFKFEGRQK